MKSFKFVSILLFLSIYSFILNAQSGSEDIVYLKNGSILHGKLLEYTEGKQLRIEIIGHNELVIPYQDVDKIIKNKKIDSDASLAKRPIEVTNAFNFYGGSKSSGGFSVLASYRFPFRLATGIGSGIDIYEYQLLPVFAEVNYSFLKGYFSPFVYGRGGVSFPLSKASSDQWNNQEYKMGTLAGIGAGFRMNFSNHSSFFFSAGYRYQKTRKVSSYPDWYSGYPTQTTERIDEFNRINISIGLIFK